MNSEEADEVVHKVMKNIQEIEMDELDSPMVEKNEINELDEESQRRKSWVVRTFSPMGPGSLRGSILSMVASAVACGILSLPYTCKMVGLAICPVLMIGSMFASIMSFTMLIDLAEVYQTYRYYYVCLFTGGKGLVYVYNFAIIVQETGAILAYQIIGGNILVQISHSLGVSEEVTEGMLMNILKVVCPAIFISYPFCRQVQMTSLRYPSFIAIVAIFYTICILIIEAPFYYAKQETHNICWTKIDSTFFQAIGVTFFAFLCQACFFPVYGDLANPSKNRIKKVAWRSCMAECALYLTTGIAGYISTLEKTQEIVTDRDPSSAVFGVLMSIGRMGIYLKVAIAVPIHYNPLRRTLYDLLFSHSQPIEEPNNSIIATVVLSISSFIAIVFPNIISVFSIVGGVSAVLLAFVIPGIAYFICYNEKKQLFPKKVAIFCIMSVLCTIIGLLSVITTMINI